MAFKQLKLCKLKLALILYLVIKELNGIINYLGCIKPDPGSIVLITALQIYKELEVQTP